MTPTNVEANGPLPVRVLAGQLEMDAAWIRVRKRTSMAGVDEVRLSAFSRLMPAVARDLERELVEGRYRSWPLRAACIRKASGGTRVLLVPTVRDRLVQTVLANWLAGRLDAQFDGASYAYRPGRGVRDALRALAERRDQGYRFVFRADIRRCFDAVPHRILVGTVARTLHHLGCDAVLDWIQACVSAPVWDGERLRARTQGLPQGSPLSPILVNSVLDALDRRMRRLGAPLVRYADDFVVLARSEMALAAAIPAVIDAVADLGFSLGADRTTRTSFEAGFRFLGADIVGHRILLPFEPRSRSETRMVASPPMPPAMRRAWRAGTLEPSGVFDPEAFGAMAAKAGDTRPNDPPEIVMPTIPSPSSSSSVLDRLRRGRS